MSAGERSRIGSTIRHRCRGHETLENTHFNFKRLPEQVINLDIPILLYTMEKLGASLYT